MHETRHSSKTVVDCSLGYLRTILPRPPRSSWRIRKRVVEIDESKFGKRKYNRGRYKEGHWVFGGVERGSNDVFVVEVKDRSAAILLPIIQLYVKPGTTVTVISDEWRAYFRIPSFRHVT